MQPLRDIQRADIRDGVDLRSWRVVGGDGTPLGVVAEVIVDVDKASPVYLDVLPDAQATGEPPECWVRIPHRYVVIDDATRRVVLTDAALLGLGTATAGLVVDRAP